MRIRLLLLFPFLLLLATCSANAPDLPTQQLATSVVSVPAASQTETPGYSSASAEGLNLVAQYDPTSRILTIFGVTPAVTIVLGGTPLALPPTPTVTRTPPPTITLSPSPLPTITTVRPSPTVTPNGAAATADALRGKILYKSARDGGAFPSSWSYYAMNADGSGLVHLDYISADALYNSLKAREGIAPGGARLVLDERPCLPGMTCNLYILDTVADAAIINGTGSPSRGQWTPLHGAYQAKTPAWSPTGNYIAFVSNQECNRTPNVYKGTPGSNPHFIRLTNFCSGADAGSPSFSPDGTQVAFWSADSGTAQIYLLTVGATDETDYHESNAHLVSDQRAPDWDPIWVK